MRDQVRLIIAHVKEIVVVVITLSVNLVRYPLIAQRINRAWLDLPDEAQTQIAGIMQREINDSDALEIWGIFNRHTCQRCGRAGRACKCS